MLACPGSFTSSGAGACAGGCECALVCVDETADGTEGSDWSEDEGKSLTAGGRLARGFRAGGGALDAAAARVRVPAARGAKLSWLSDCWAGLSVLRALRAAGMGGRSGLGRAVAFDEVPRPKGIWRPLLPPPPICGTERAPCCLVAFATASMAARAEEVPAWAIRSVGRQAGCACVCAGTSLCAKGGRPNEKAILVWGMSAVNRGVDTPSPCRGASLPALAPLCLALPSSSIMSSISDDAVCPSFLLRRFPAMALRFRIVTSS